MKLGHNFRIVSKKGENKKIEYIAKGNWYGRFVGKIADLPIGNRLRSLLGSRYSLKNIIARLNEETDSSNIISICSLDKTNEKEQLNRLSILYEQVMQNKISGDEKAALLEESIESAKDNIILKSNDPSITSQAFVGNVGKIDKELVINFFKSVKANKSEDIWKQKNLMENLKYHLSEPMKTLFGGQNYVLSDLISYFTESGLVKIPKESHLSADNPSKEDFSTVLALFLEQNQNVGGAEPSLGKLLWEAIFQPIFHEAEGDLENIIKPENFTEPKQNDLHDMVKQNLSDFAEIVDNLTTDFGD